MDIFCMRISKMSKNWINLFVIIVTISNIVPRVSAESSSDEEPEAQIPEEQGFWLNYGDSFYSHVLPLNSPEYNYIMPILASNISGQRTSSDPSLRPTINVTEAQNVLLTTNYNLNPGVVAPTSVSGRRRKRSTRRIRRQRKY